MRKCVYLLVKDEDGQCLIGTKSYLNYHGGIKFMVNQPGQYALPGGHCENETTEETAIREYKEETGIDLSNDDLEEVYSTDEYCVYVCRKDDLRKLKKFGNSYICRGVAKFAKLNKLGKKNNYIPPLEISKLDIIPINEIENYLGVEIPLDHSNPSWNALSFMEQTFITNEIHMYPHRNRIDWFQQIAAVIYSRYCD